MYSNHRRKTLLITTPILGVDGSPADVASIALPTNVNKWIPVFIGIRSIDAVDLQSATIDIRTASGGGGISILSSAINLTSFTGASDLIDSASLATLTSVLTATNLYIRQTADSANAGNISIMIEYLDYTT